jgi:hypothetical protein
VTRQNPVRVSGKGKLHQAVSPPPNVELPWIYLHQLPHSYLTQSGSSGGSWAILQNSGVQRVEKRRKSGYNLNKHCPVNPQLHSHACRNSANGNGLLLDRHNDSTLQYKVLTINILWHKKKQMKINILDKKGSLCSKRITLHSYKLMMGIDNPVIWQRVLTTPWYDNVYSSRIFPTFLVILFTVIHGKYVHRDDEESYYLINEATESSEPWTFFYQSTRHCIQKAPNFRVTTMSILNRLLST